jgi:hypothetical protein
MIWDGPKIPKLYLGLTFLIWQLTNLLSLAIRILKLSWTYHFFFIKEALQVFWVQRYDLLSQINYHKYLQSMDKSMCQWINQSINKSIYKRPKTPWSKVLIQSKTHAVLLSCLFNAKSIFLHKSCGRFIIFNFSLWIEGDTSLILEEQPFRYSLFLAVTHAVKQISVSLIL